MVESMRCSRELYESRDHSPSSHKSRIDPQMHFIPLACHYGMHKCWNDIINSFATERSVLAIQHTLYSKGSNGMGGALDLPIQVVIMSVGGALISYLNNL